MSDALVDIFNYITEKSKNFITDAAFIQLIKLCLGVQYLKGKERIIEHCSKAPFGSLSASIYLRGALLGFEDHSSTCSLTFSSTSQRALISADKRMRCFPPSLMSWKYSTRNAAVSARAAMLSARLATSIAFSS